MNSTVPNILRYFRNPFSWIFILCCFVFMYACSTAKKIKQKPLAEKTVAQLLDSLTANEFKPEYFNAKCNANILLDGKENSVSANIRMKKDSVIWISLSTIGFEMARAVLYKDSIKIIDRLNSDYMITDFSYIENKFNTSISFDDVQAIILGNPFYINHEKRFKSAYIDSSRYVLSTLGKRKLKKNIVEDKDPNKKFVQDIWIDPANNKLSKLFIEDLKTEIKFICKYTNFKALENGVPFPFNNNIEIKSVKNIQLSLEYSKINVNKSLEFPFTISENMRKLK